MKLLIVEDDLTSRTILTAIVKKWGFEPIAVEDGEAAWEVMQADDELRLLLIDWEMPRLNGHDLCKRLREQKNSDSLYMIFLTVRSDTSDIVAGLEAGANDYIPKPFENKELQARLEVGRRMLELQSSLIKSEKEIAAQSKQFSVAIDNIADGIITISELGIIEFFNPAARKIFAYSTDEVIGQNVKTLIPELDHNEPDGNLDQQRKILEKKISGFKGEVVGLRKDGSTFSIELTISTISIDNVKRYVGIARDVTERKNAEEKIQNLAFYDQLTNLPNRQLLLDRFKQALVVNARNNKQGALLFIDLDNFKKINDTLGHDMGDELLKQVTDRLMLSVRGGDTVARLGGDEFVVMLLDLNGQTIEAAAQTTSISEKILSVIRQPYQLEQNSYRCTASIGVVMFNGHQQKVEELMKQADIAMYQAKKAGRNTLRFFDPQMQDNISKRVLLEIELQTALELQQFQLHYQIQVDNHNNPLGAEALIRWVHPEHGLVPPMEFIPLAEETGLIIPIGLWVLDSACAQIKAWQVDVHSRELVISINVSAKQFHQTDFVAQVKAALQRHAINPKLLKLEITESLLQNNLEETIAVMTTLNNLGVSFSLDDFGTGYSSLQYLKQLPLDELKIDQSFVRDIETDKNDRVIVSTIIAMAQILRMNVIAEGVETTGQQQLLLDSNCTYFQGYLFSKPVPIEQLDMLLNSK